MLYPIKLSPCYKSYLWGGTKLRDLFHKKTDLDCIAESWELACHANGTSLVENGIYQGKSLQEVLAQLGLQVLGDVAKHKRELPILVKLIDAKEDLSIQVHPSDETAKEGEQGKAEMWYIVDCDPHSYLYCGFSKDITPQELQERVENGSICEVLNKIPVKKGDVFYIFPQTIHAICKGVLIAEVQQNSDTTFRIYDYDRYDKEGKKRDLHLARGLEVLSLEGTIPQDPAFNCTMQVGGISMKLLFSCPYFSTYLIQSEQEQGLCCDLESFQHLLVLEGSGSIVHQKESYPLQKGDSYFLPAGLGSYHLIGEVKLLLSKR